MRYKRVLEVLRDWTRAGAVVTNVGEVVATRLHTRSWGDRVITVWSRLPGDVVTYTACGHDKYQCEAELFVYDDEEEDAE